MIQFTHIFDLIRRLIGLAIGLSVTLPLTKLLGRPYADALNGLDNGSVAWWLLVLLGISIFLVIITAAMYVVFVYIFTSTMSAWLYVNIRLRTQVNWSEARAISFLFDLDRDGKWYPCTEILKFPSSQRRSRLFRIAAAHANAKNA